jgi:opacity protein-like surface antigen
MGAPREASAQVQSSSGLALGGDFDVALPVVQSTTPAYLSTGAGFDLRVGYRWRVPYQPLWITPELAAGYTDLLAHVVRVRPGVRIAFGSIVVPFVYSHIGWGYTSFDPLGAADTRGLGSFVSSTGLSLDAGAGVDFAVLRRLLVGAHLGYNVVTVGQTGTTPGQTTPGWNAKWMSIGLGGTFLF